MRVLYQSPKICIREFSPSEEFLFCVFFENKAITRFLPDLSQKEYGELFRKALIDYQNGPFGRWGIFISDTDDCIGNCLLRKFADIQNQLEIGYSLKPEFWGQGIATESVRAMVCYGFANTATNDIVAVTALDNIGSQKVLKKVGFKKLSNLKRNELELTYFHIGRQPH